MKLVVLIRAHQFSEQEAFLAERLEAAFKSAVIFVTDDTILPVHTGRFAKIGIRKHRVRELIGGRILPQWGWQFGDVFFYAARDAFREATHFAMIESDVFLSAAGAARLADVFCGRSEDVLAAKLVRTDVPHAFSKDLDKLGKDNHVSCFFPVTRASREAIDLMQALRRREREVPQLRVNDEAIMASTAFSGEVHCANLSEIEPDLFDPEGFTIDRTQLFEHLSGGYQDVPILHPVRNVKAMIARIEEFGGARNFRRKYREAIEQAVPRHRQKLRKALAAAEARRAVG